jgi:hypothetical protein
MRFYSIALATICRLSSQTFAGDQSHPYYSSIRSAHSSLAVDSPKWFPPGYGYVQPHSLVSQQTLVPYLSLRADAPFEPYAFRDVKQSAPTQYTYNCAGRVWPVPGDVPGFRIDALQNYGNLPSAAGIPW